MDKIKIIQDNQEKEDEIFYRLKSFSDIDLEVKDLYYGDYVLSDELAVERKAGDLFSSFKTLPEILQGLKDNFKRHILLWEGKVQPVYYDETYGPHYKVWGKDKTWPMIRRWNPVNVELILNSFNKKYGTYIMRSPSPTMTAQYLRGLAKNEQEEGRVKFTGIRMREKVMTLEEKQLFFLEGLVGPKTAKLLYEKFNKKPIDICNADLTSLYSIDGIGPMTVSEILSILGRQ